MESGSGPQTPPQSRGGGAEVDRARSGAAKTRERLAAALTAAMEASAGPGDMQAPSAPSGSAATPAAGVQPARASTGRAAPSRAPAAGPQEGQTRTSPSLGAIEVDVEIYVGGARHLLRTVSAAQPGSVLPLDTKVGDPAVAAVKGRIVAWGEIVVMPDESLGFRVTRVVPPGGEDLDRPSWMP